MAKTPKQHKSVGEDYLATAKQASATHRFPFPAQMVWNALLDGDAWTQWLPITKVKWTSPRPFSVGTTRTVEIGDAVIEETFFAWEEGRRMAFRFERSTLPISAGAEDYSIIDADGGCELRWTGKTSAFFPLGFLITTKLTKDLGKGLTELEKLLASEPERFKTN